MTQRAWSRPSSSSPVSNVVHQHRAILDRSSRTNVGGLMLTYGGGGHVAAGTCQVANDRADATLAALIETINADG